VEATREDADRDGVTVPMTLEEYCIKAVPRPSEDPIDSLDLDDDYYDYGDDDSGSCDSDMGFFSLGEGVATSGWGGGYIPPNSQKKKRSLVSPKSFLLRGKIAIYPPTPMSGATRLAADRPFRASDDDDEYEETGEDSGQGEN
jgi:hypothetical protein